MKTKEEIEQLAFLKYPRLINDPYNPMEDDNTYERQIWIDAYTQCQEDMTDKKYTFNQIVDSMQMAREVDGKETYYKYSIEQILELLNKQD